MLTNLPGRYLTRHLEGQMGARKVELDTQLATDGVEVLCHDDSLSVTGMDGHNATPSTDRCSVSRVRLLLWKGDARRLAARRGSRRQRRSCAARDSRASCETNRDGRWATVGARPGHGLLTMAHLCRYSYSPGLRCLTQFKSSTLKSARSLTFTMESDVFVILSGSPRFAGLPASR